MYMFKHLLHSCFQKIMSMQCWKIFQTLCRFIETYDKHLTCKDLKFSLQIFYFDILYILETCLCVDTVLDNYILQGIIFQPEWMFY